MTDLDPADELAAELAKEVVAREAPAELRLFGVTSRAYFANPDRALKRGSKDEMLGFGVESAAILTPYALAVARPVAQFIMKEVLQEVTTRSNEAILKFVQRLFGRTGEPTAAESETPEIQPLSQEQLAHVRELALGKARELDIEDAKAVLLAEAMVGCLVLGPA